MMSSKFGRLERKMAALLQRFPVAKQIARKAYARTINLLHKRTCRAKSDHRFTSIGPQDQETFFGYYDKTPESQDGHVLCHVAASSTRGLPAPDKPIRAALFAPTDLTNPIFSTLVTSYNWQQGCRLQWVSGDGFMFNTYDGDALRYRANLVNGAPPRIAHVFDEPVQDAFGLEYYLSLNYDRLGLLSPDYGYRDRSIEDRRQLPSLDEDGIMYVSMKTGMKKLLYSIGDLCRVDHDPAFDFADHEINHVMISPNGEKFLLLHRYFLGRRRFDRLLLADVRGHGLRVIAQNKMVSHYAWVDDDSILVYLRSPHGVDGYFVVSTVTNVHRQFGEGCLDTMGDGHPHVNGELFVTDTYPDRARMQSLLLVHIERQCFQVLAELYHGFEFSGQCRCDLHPRLSPRGDRVYFDTVYNGNRRLTRLELGADERTSAAVS